MTTATAAPPRRGAFRVEDELGYVVARFITDSQGIAWAHVYARANARARRPMTLERVLELVAAGELELVRISEEG